MADNTGIEWTDATWNPVTGCDKVSPGCDHCYAETLAHRFDGTPQFPNGFRVTLRPERLDIPMRWRRPRRIFVNSMSDLFHDVVPDEYIARVFAVMATTPRHTYQVLTKRHGRMRSLLGDPTFYASRVLSEVQTGWSAEAAQQVQMQHGWPLPNVWLGVSAENQQWADIRIPSLLDTPAAVRFVSAEPLLGAIDFKHWYVDPVDTRYPAIDWVIVGGESGRDARPMHPDWARSLRDQCQGAGVAFLLKQWGEYRPWLPGDGECIYVHRESGRTVGEDIVRESGPGHWMAMRRTGKRSAGRRLDGRTWDQYPEVTHVG